MSGLYADSDLIPAAASPCGSAFPVVEDRKLRAAEKEAILVLSQESLGRRVSRGNVLMGYSRNCRLHGSAVVQLHGS